MLDLKLSRRTFLQAAAVTGAGLTILGTSELGRKVARGSAPESTYEWVPNICTMCVNTCGIKVKVRKTGSTTRAVKIDGNPASPYNKGKICARGQAGLRRVYDPQRITTPLLRVEGSKRGEFKFRQATWEEAYNYIGMKLQQEKIMPWEMAASGGWISCAFYRPYLLGFAFAMEIPNILATPMQHCVMSEHFGIDSALGTFNVHDEIVADYDKAHYYLAMGANAAVAGVATGRAVRFTEGKRNGMKVVVVDPRLSELASKADEWLPIKPGTDLAFVLAMMNVILKKDLYDDEFVRKHTNLPFLVMTENNMVMPVMEQGGPMGLPKSFAVYDEISGTVRKLGGFPANQNFVDIDGKPIRPALQVPQDLKVDGKPVVSLFQVLQQSAAQYTPEWAGKITDIPAETIERIATEFASTRPALMEPGWHDSRYSNTVQFRKVAALIQGLIGGIDRPGGWVFVGGSREGMHNFVDMLMHQQMPQSPLQLPGLFSPNAALQMRFNAADAWSHKHPSINEAWNQNEWQNGRPGVGFNLYTDAGYKEALEGKLQYGGQPYNLRAIFMSQTNLVRNFFGWKEMLANPNMKLVVAWEIGPSDTLPYADVILPDTAYLEKYDPIFEVGMSHDIGLTTRVPSIPAPGQVKHTLDVFFEMAMGFKVDMVKQIAGIYLWDYAKLNAAIGKAMQEGKGATYGIQQYQLADLSAKLRTTPEKLMATFREQGIVELEKREELIEKMGMPHQLPLSTPSGRYEYFSLFMAGLVQRSGQMTAEGHPLMTWVQPQWKPGMKAEDKLTADDEFFITYGKAPTGSHAATSNNDLLVALNLEHEHQRYGVWINPTRARKLGVSTGDRIKLTNNLSGQTVTGVAFVTEMTRPDTLFISAGFGTENPDMKNGYGRGVALSNLFPFRLEPVVGGYKLSETTIKVAKA